jgi:hypothetical protein
MERENKEKVGRKEKRVCMVSSKEIGAKGALVKFSGTWEKVYSLWQHFVIHPHMV